MKLLSNDYQIIKFTPLSMFHADLDLLISFSELIKM